MTSCNDEVLREHLSTAGANATYILPMAQNELIDAMSRGIQHKIVEEINTAQFFAILADEMTDFSGQEQLSVCLRYVFDAAVRERFICFAVVTDLTGSGLVTQLLDILQSLGIDASNMVGQGYDGAAAMSGDRNGVQRHIKDKFPARCNLRALRCPFVKLVFGQRV